jgi:hypothetical protein
MKKIIIFTAIGLLALIQVQAQNSFSGESGLFAMDTKNPELTVNAPTGGETFNYLEPLDIGYTATDDSFGETPIAAGLSTEEGGAIAWLAQDLENSGSAQLELPHQETAFAQAHIMATDAYGNQSTAASNGYFDLLQGIFIPQGWSIISSWRQPENPAMNHIFGELNAQNKVSIMINKKGIYWPAYNINTIGDWDVYDGYKLKLTSSGSILIPGEAPGDKTFNAVQGANYLPMLCDVPVEAAGLLSQFGENLLYAFDIYSGNIYWPAGGIFDLDTLKPGTGYLLGMHQPASATYTCGKTSGSGTWTRTQPIVYQDAPWSIHKSGTAHFIAINSSALSHLEAGDFIGVFNAGGRCMGMAQYTGSSENLLLLAYADDETTEAKDGFAPAEHMHFRIFHQATAKQSPAEVEWDYSMPNTAGFAENGQSRILKLATGATAIADLQMENIEIHPNPNKGVFDIKIPNVRGELTIEISNASGMNIHSEKFMASETNISHQINLGNAPAGVYFVRISNGSGLSIKKVVIQ